MKSLALYSIFSQKCPRCHTGEMFDAPTYDLKHFREMKLKCDCCGQPFHLEPMFYEGAQYVSYSLQVALFVTFFVAFRVLFDDFSVSSFVTTVALSSILLIPLTWRLSRIIWIHFFVRYKGACKPG